MDGVRFHAVMVLGFGLWFAIVATWVIDETAIVACQSASVIAIMLAQLLAIYDTLQRMKE